MEPKFPLYTVAEEPGFEAGLLPTWTDIGAGTIQFNPTPEKPVTRREVTQVPGAFQLLNLLSTQEVDQFVMLAEQAGFHADAPVSLPHTIRHNHNFNWVVSRDIDHTLWTRCHPHIPEIVQGQKACGINARFRFYRYQQGDYFSPHIDGSWPGSRVINGHLVTDAYPGRHSQYTFLIQLSEDFEGGRTQFYVDRDNPNQGSRSQADSELISVSTPKGAVLCFPHGMHPQHCLHGSETIRKGTKYIIRTDILFEHQETPPS
ncbi:2OG-Fe(II) oxygenase [Magnetococcus sp. PR-3]|uniref:2OG-Fe(II) oxygenase n=1 Tax=Magnetococcus sp. PR-3 TaxID=3120355 RepID=UPI002FCE67DB